MKPELRQIFATTKLPNSETFISSSAFLILLSLSISWSFLCLSMVLSLFLLFVPFCFLFTQSKFPLHFSTHSYLNTLLSLLKNYMILFYRKKNSHLSSGGKEMSTVLNILDTFFHSPHCYATSDCSLTQLCYDMKTALTKATKSRLIPTCKDFFSLYPIRIFILL